MKSPIVLIAATLLAISSVSLAADAPVAGPAASQPAAQLGIPGPSIPDGLGVNIHFCDARPGEMKMLADAGFRFIRMDLNWGGTERKAGEYDFSAFDRLLASLDQYHIRAVLILDYSNRMYDGGLSPHTDEGRKAFARWAAAAASHFRGRGVLWEMYNEPNIGFWKPKPDVKEYIPLALEVGKALRAAEPNEVYVGPATSTIDMTFLEECFKAGLLEYWQAVSVHPYRQGGPETVAAEYAKLRYRIDQYAPKGKRIPIISGEWGYSAGWGKFDETLQGKMLPRELMMNLACDVPVSIWYDWHDDGKDPKEPEHHFGTVKNEYLKDQDPVYQPKPAYLAARTLTTVLAGFHYNKRLALEDANDYVLLFSKGEEVRLAAWTISKTPHEAVIPASAGKFAATAHTGEELPELTADANGLTVTLNDGPQYLMPRAANDLLRLATTWERSPLEICLPGRMGITMSLKLQNSLSRTIDIMVSKGEILHPFFPGATVSTTATFDLPRTPNPVVVPFNFQIYDGEVSQKTIAHAADPLSVKPLPPSGKTLLIQIDNAGGTAANLTVRLKDVEGFKPARLDGEIDLSDGQTQANLLIPVTELAPAGYQYGLTVYDQDKSKVLEMPAVKFTPLPDFSTLSADSLAKSYKLWADGDAKAQAKLELSLAAPSEGPPADGIGVMQISYEFLGGWKFACLSPQGESLQKIDGEPKALGMWVYGDGSGVLLRARFNDAKGQCFQPDGGAIKWKGWRYVTLPMQGQMGHWGGPDDGVIHYPIRWNTLVLLDGSHKKVSGKVYIACPTLVR